MKQKPHRLRVPRRVTILFYWKKALAENADYRESMFSFQMIRHRVRRKGQVSVYTSHSLVSKRSKTKLLQIRQKKRNDLSFFSQRALHPRILRHVLFSQIDLLKLRIPISVVTAFLPCHCKLRAETISLQLQISSKTSHIYRIFRSKISRFQNETVII